MPTAYSGGLFCLNFRITSIAISLVIWRAVWTCLFYFKTFVIKTVAIYNILAHDILVVESLRVLAIGLRVVSCVVRRLPLCKKKA